MEIVGMKSKRTESKECGEKNWQNLKTEVKVKGWWWKRMTDVSTSRNWVIGNALIWNRGEAGVGMERRKWEDNELWLGYLQYLIVIFMRLRTWRKIWVGDTDLWKGIKLTPKKLYLFWNTLLLLAQGTQLHFLPYLFHQIFLRPLDTQSVILLLLASSEPFV